MGKTYRTFVSSSKTYHSIRYVLMLIISVCPLSSLRGTCLFSLSQLQKGGKIVRIIENLLQFFMFDLTVH